MNGILGSLGIDPFLLIYILIYTSGGIDSFTYNTQ